MLLYGLTARLNDLVTDLINTFKMCLLFVLISSISLKSIQTLEIMLTNVPIALFCTLRQD